MPKKSSAYYQRQYRERLRSQGLVKKEVWILPDHAKTLSSVENLLRDEIPATELGLVLKGEKSESSKCWITRDLYHGLQIEQEKGLSLNHIKMTLIEPATDYQDQDELPEPIIHIVMQDFGDLPIFMTVQGEQIIAETILCTVDEVTDPNDFNQMVLRTHKYFPLSTISLDTLVMSDGNTYDAYQMFGSLSSYSGIDEIILEIQTLASNVMQALEAYSEYFKTEI